MRSGRSDRLHNGQQRRGTQRKTGNFRVLAGKYKGASLAFPGEAGTHPMGAREKLALFNIISTSGMRVLDAYAGSGALGIEALSRGAEEVVFVEQNAKAVAAIRENLAKIGAKADGEGKAQKDEPKIGLEGAEKAPEARESANGYTSKVWMEKVGKFAQRSEYEGYFDRILADPPYKTYEALHAERGVQGELEALVRLLRGGGKMVLSSQAMLAAPEIAGLEIESTRTYAGARITVYNKR